MENTKEEQFNETQLSEEDGNFEPEIESESPENILLKEEEFGPNDAEVKFNTPTPTPVPVSSFSPSPSPVKRSKRCPQGCIKKTRCKKMVKGGKHSKKSKKSKRTSKRTSKHSRKSKK
jgi:hypothetical protein